MTIKTIFDEEGARSYKIKGTKKISSIKNVQLRWESEFLKINKTKIQF